MQIIIIIVIGKKCLVAYCIQLNEMCLFFAFLVFDWCWFCVLWRVQSEAPDEVPVFVALSSAQWYLILYANATTAFCNRPCRWMGRRSCSQFEYSAVRRTIAIAKRNAFTFLTKKKMRKLYLMRSITVRIRISPHSAYAPRAQNHRYIPHTHFAQRNRWPVEQQDRASVLSMRPIYIWSRLSRALAATETDEIWRREKWKESAQWTHRMAFVPRSVMKTN